MIADNRDRPGSRRRDDLGAGLRSIHVELAARRRGSALHVLYYLRGPLDDGRDGTIIARLLHEANGAFAASDPGSAVTPVVRNRWANQWSVRKSGH